MVSLARRRREPRHLLPRASRRGAPAAAEQAAGDAEPDPFAATAPHRRPPPPRRLPAARLPPRPRRQARPRRPHAPPPRRRPDARRLLAARPEAVLRAHDHVFASRPFNPLADILAYGLLDVGFAPYGERWRQAKRLLTTHLLTARKVRSFRGAREAEVRLAVARARGAAAAGEALDLSALLKAYTNDVMCRSVSARFFLEDGRNRRIPELTDVVKDMFGAFKLRTTSRRWRGWPCSPGRRSSRPPRSEQVGRPLRQFDTLIDFHVQRRQDDGDVEEEESDFIDVMLALKDEYGLTRNHIKAIMMVHFNSSLAFIPTLYCVRARITYRA
jgi:hypothetical protein